MFCLKEKQCTETISMVRNEAQNTYQTHINIISTQKHSYSIIPIYFDRMLRPHRHAAFSVFYFSIACVSKKPKPSHRRSVSCPYGCDGHKPLTKCHRTRIDLSIRFTTPIFPGISISHFEFHVRMHKECGSSMKHVHQKYPHT